MAKAFAAIVLFFAYALLCAYLLTSLLQVGKPRSEQPVHALCKDPFAEYTGIMFESCDRVNRYWDI